MAFAQTVSAKILRLALLAQDDIEGTAVLLSLIAATVGRPQGSPLREASKIAPRREPGGFGVT